MNSDGVDVEFGGSSVGAARPIRATLIELANRIVSWQHLCSTTSLFRDASRHRLLASLFPLLALRLFQFIAANMLSSTRFAASMALRGLRPPPRTLIINYKANIGDSQTRRSFHAIPRRKRSLYIVYVLKQCHIRVNAEGWNRYWQPRNAASHEAGATRSAIAEPGRKEGSCPIRTVCRNLC